MSTPDIVEVVLTEATNTVEVVVAGPQGIQGETGPTGPTGPPTTDASLLTTGTLPDGRLSANVVVLSGTQTITGVKSFQNGLTLGASADATLARGATGPTIDAQAAGGFRSRNLANSADAPISGSTGTLNQLVLSGNISSAAWTTSGLRIKGVTATLTDTTSTGTVAAAYTDVLGGNTIAASGTVTFTNYITAFFKEPTAGTNVTFTNKWALGAESLRVGTSNQLTVTNAGVVTAGGTVNLTATNAGVYAFKLPSPNAVSGNFNLGGCQFPAVNADGSDNYVWSSGINIAPNGARENTALPGVRFAMESRWVPTGVTPNVEMHLEGIATDGTAYRWWSVIMPHAGTTSIVSHRATQHTWYNQAGSAKFQFNVDSNNISYSGTTLAQQSNNVAWLTQRNAADSAALSLPYYNSSDQLVANAVATTLVSPTLSCPTGDLVLTSANNVVRVRNGTNAQKFTVSKTYIDASNYNRFFIQTQASTNNTLIGMEYTGTGSGIGATSSNIQFSCPSVLFQTTTTTTTGAIFRQLASQTASLVEFQDSSNSVGVSISANGKVFSVNNTGLGGVAMNVFAPGAGNVVAIQSNNLATNNRMIDLIVGNSVTGTVNATYLVGSASSNLVHYMQQNGAGFCGLDMLLVGSGDCGIRMGTNGVTTWTWALDNSDSDAVVLSASSSPGTSNAIRIDASTLQLRLYGALRLSNTAVAATPTPTHTITIVDGAGTTYRVPCVV